MDIERLKAAFIKADDAGNVEDAKAFAATIRKYEAEAPKQDPEGYQDTRGGIPAFRAFIDQGIQGLSFGYADELMAKGDKYLFGLDEEKQLAKYRGQEQSNRENNPIASLAGDLAGGLALGGGAVKGGLTLAGKATNLLPRIGLMGAEGAAYGAAYGSGNATEGNRLEGAVGGGIAGGLVGGAIPAVGAAYRTVGAPLLKPIGDAITSRVRPDQFAARKVAERLTNDGRSLPQMQQRLANSEGLSVADVAGENARNLLKTTTNVPGPAQNRVQTQLTMRQMGQGDRLKKSLAKTFADPEGYLSVRDEIADVSKKMAAPLYKRAYENPIEFSDELKNILKTPAGKQAFAKGLDIAKNEGGDVGEMLATKGPDGKMTFKQIPDMKIWDYIKRGFDDVIEGQTDNLTGKTTTMGRSVVGLKNRMLSIIDDANPDYAAARKVASDGFKVDDALEWGRKSAGMSPEAIKRKMATASEAEKQAIRVGRAEDIRKRLDSAGWTHNKVSKIFGSTDQYRALRELFPSQSQFQTFKKTILEEVRKQKTFDKVRGQSSTAKQLMDIEDSGKLNEVGSAVGDAFKGNIGSMVSKVANIVTRIGGFTPQVADGVAKRLSTTDPAMVRQIMRELEQVVASKISNDQKKRAIGEMLSRIGGQQAGALTAN